MATGFLLFVFGLWVVFRTVRKDAHGKNLVDAIAG